jgi:hypothetical protein
MSTAPKHKKRKIGSTTGQRGEGSATNEAHPGKVESGPKTEFRFSSEIDHAIWCAVLGKPSPWLIDLEFERVGSFEDRFRAGDKQILLWELFDCWRDNRPIPQWAGEALFSGDLKLAITCSSTDRRLRKLGGRAPFQHCNAVRVQKGPQSSMHSGNSVPCTRSVSSTKRFIRPPQQNRCCKIG